MAVVQISKIQLRRGKEQETGIPQLAGGEMAWAVDTQKLYIGNGAVSEGAPAVGNTRILTETDNILDIVGSYSYKSSDPNIQTGADANFPVTRSLQGKLDDFVSSADYGILPDGTDQTVKIQRAIDNLFLNPATRSDTGSRVTLMFLPGTYKISGTIYIPSYARIAGAGKQKTVFSFQASSSTVFEFINDTSTSSVRSSIGSTTYINQPKFCSLTGFSIIVNGATSESMLTGFKLNAVRDSVFEDIEMLGGYNDSTVAAGSIAIGMYAVSSVVTTQRNHFNRMSVDGFTFVVFAKQDIFDNTFEHNKYSTCQFGFNFGTGANLSSPGEQFGPRNNNILNNYFENIDRNAIYIVNGRGNSSRGNTFVNVGNDGGANSNNVYAQIQFVSAGNTSSNDVFDRHIELSTAYSEDYVNEIDGAVQYDSSRVYEVNLPSQAASGAPAFRLPLARDTSYEINYIVSSNTLIQVRRGRMTVVVDAPTGLTQFVDDYEYVGAGGTEELIRFASQVIAGDLYINYFNLNPNDVSVMRYTYRMLS